MSRSAGFRVGKLFAKSLIARIERPTATIAIIQEIDAGTVQRGDRLVGPKHFLSGASRRQHGDVFFRSAIRCTDGEP